MQWANTGRQARPRLNATLGTRYEELMRTVRGLVAAIMAIFFAPVLCMAEGKTLESIGAKADMHLNRCNVLEEALAKITDVAEKARARRDLILVLRALAVDYSYLKREAERIKVLYRIEMEYEELQKIGPANKQMAGDIMKHVDFLCDIGFGGISDVGYRQPEPDYLKALKILEEFSDVLGQAGKDKKNRILGPAIGVSARWTNTAGEAVVDVFVRNVEQVTVSIREKQPGSSALVSWPVTFKTDLLSDHRTHAQTFRVSGIVLQDKSLSVMAGANSEVQDVAEFWNSPPHFETYLPGDPPYTQIDSAPAGAVKSLYPRISISRGSNSHSMNQVCSICHIPHSTSGE